MKLCARCHRRKGTASFATAKGYRKGRNSQCRPCRRRTALESYYRRRASVAARNRTRYYANLSASRRRQRLAARRRARALGVKPKRVFHAEAARRRAQAANKRRYAERHPARVATSKAQWRTRHPDQAKATQINAKARRRGSPGDITASEWKAILLFYGNRCAKCRASAAKRPLTADHFIPVRAGGTNTWRNVWPLCLSCNVSKRDRIPSDPAPPHVAVLRRTLRKESA